MTGLVTGAALVFSLGLTGWESGWAVYYAENRMEHVARTRQIAPQPCMVAYTHARDADMGQLWLRVAGPAGMVDCLIVDLPRPGKDKQNLIRRGVIVELGYANRWICGAGWTGRATDCRVRVIRR